MAIGFGSLGRARGTALYSLTFLIALAIYWSTTTWPSSNDFHGTENFSVNEKASYMLGVAPCPNPNLPLLPVNRPLDPATQTCSHIDLVEDSGFQVEICPVKATCNRFSIIITRQDQDFCSEMEAREFNFTLSAEREDWMRNKQGPDSFSIRTSGAQRWAAEDSVYQGDCKYKFDVTLSNGGPVWLQLWHLYENYSYFDDGVYFMPTNLNKDLLTAPLKLNLCPERCPMSYAPRINAPEPEFPVGAVNTMVEIPDLPECPVEGHLDGIWLQRHPMDVTEPPSKLVYKMVPQAKQTLMGHYEYVAGCKWTHSGRQFVDHTPCTKKPFKIMFAGDSHTRYAMQHFIWRMNGSTDVFPWRGPTFDSYHIDYDQLSIDFKWDPMVRVLLGSWRPEQFLEYDSIVFSAGSWPTKFNLNIEDWMTKTDEFFEKIHDAISSSAKRPILTYLMPTPFPPHNRTTQRDEEHRTNIQLARWRDGFMALCEKYGWRTVDQFTIGMPVNLEMSSADGLHLSPGPSHAWIVDELVGKAGLCQ